MDPLTGCGIALLVVIIVAIILLFIVSKFTEHIDAKLVYDSINALYFWAMVDICCTIANYYRW